MNKQNKPHIFSFILVGFFCFSLIGLCALLIACPAPGTTAVRQVAQPSFSPAGGTFATDQNITITCVSTGATIYYTTDGSTPNTSSTIYTSPIPVLGDGATITLQACAMASGAENSIVTSATYAINSPMVATPQFSLPAGTYYSNQSVTITCATSGATIYYTTDGSTPTTSSTVYSSPLVLSLGTSMTIRAYGIKSGKTSSFEATASYKIFFSTVQWARTIYSGTDETIFNSLAVDSSGNIYTAGSIYNNGTFEFGNGIIAQGTNIYGSNIVLVKYNPSGLAQWARTVSSGSYDSQFNSVAVDSSGNIYAAGYIDYGGTFGFGNGVTAQGGNNGNNIVLVKYDSSGFAQWARTVTSSTSSSQFHSVAVDSSGNIYAAGYIYYNGTFGFGNGVTAQSGSLGENIVLVKYDSSGLAQWARTVSSSTSSSQFYSVAIDSSGNIYTAGYISYNGTFDFGNGVTAQGTNNSAGNIVLVKYDSSGLAQWARTVSQGSDASSFSSVAVDSSGNIYSAGSIVSSGTFGFGNGVTAQGTCNFGTNIVLVKYNSSGLAQWARTVSSGTSRSQFRSVAVDSSGNIYAAGFIYSSGIFGFGNGVTAQGSCFGENIVLVKYDSSGLVQWAQSVSSSSYGFSMLNAVTADLTNKVYAAGYIRGTENFIFGDGISVQSTYSGNNIVLIRY